MKKATFLLVFFVFCFNMSFKGIRAEDFSFSGYTISLEEEMIDEEKKIIVTKGGINPFETVFGIEGYDLSYNGVTVFGEHFIIYGYAFCDYDMRNYSGFFFVLNKDGDIIFGDEGILDYNFNEDIKNVYAYDNRLVIELQQTDDIGFYKSVLSHIYVLYNESYELLAEHIIEEYVKEVVINDKILLGRYQSGDLFDFGILSSGEIVWQEDDIGVNDGEVYNQEVCLKFINQIMLNDEIVSNYICVDTIGTHHIIDNNRTTTFHIEPLIEGVEDGHIYYEPVTISFNGGYGTLNGDSYSSHQEIVDIGQYVFVIEGLNEYKKELHFEIGAVVEGITNNTIYDKGVTIEFTGQGYLNNQYISSPFHVENEGEYIFKIKGQDGYLESYYFEIMSNKEESRFLDFLQKVDVFILGTVLIIGIVVVKKKR